MWFSLATAVCPVTSGIASTIRTIRGWWTRVELAVIYSILICNVMKDEAILATWGVTAPFFLWSLQWARVTGAIAFSAFLILLFFFSSVFFHHSLLPSLSGVIRVGIWVWVLGLFVDYLLDRIHLLNLLELVKRKRLVIHLYLVFRCHDWRLLGISNTIG